LLLEINKIKEKGLKTEETSHDIFKQMQNALRHYNRDLESSKSIEEQIKKNKELTAKAIKEQTDLQSKLTAKEKDFLNTDWTLGCIAVSDMEIDELYKWVIVNCPILILP
jgi:predicted patatin/cPLA2 family phospholipase